MTAGEGGMIITNDDDLEVKIRSVHDCGRMPGEWFYSHFIYGSNYRLSEWQGAILSQQLARLDEQAAVRTANAAYLDEALAAIDGITPQWQDPRCTLNGHYCYIFDYDPAAFAGLSTPAFIKALEAEGIPTQASYPPIHELEMFQNGEYRKRLAADHAAEEHAFLKAAFPHSEHAATHSVWLVHRTLLGSQQDTADIVGGHQEDPGAGRSAGVLMTNAGDLALEVLSWADTGYRPLVFSDGWQVALLNWEPIFDLANVGEIERHNHTDEVFVLVRGRAALFVVTPDGPARGGYASGGRVQRAGRGLA